MKDYDAKARCYVVIQDGRVAITAFAPIGVFTGEEKRKFNDYFTGILGDDFEFTKTGKEWVVRHDGVQYSISVGDCGILIANMQLFR
ncbi:MAG: hypothetical protein WCV63_10105 [Negativicutes bacterium]|jgi:hypothetical protein